MTTCPPHDFVPLRNEAAICNKCSTVGPPAGAAAGGASAGVPHHLPLFGGTRKLIVSARIVNRSETRAINVKLHVDGGCEVAELVLSEDDVTSLGLVPTGEVSRGMQVDGSLIEVVEYESVFVELVTDDGQTWRVSMHPSVLRTPASCNSESESAGVSATIDNSRLLGYRAITRLGLKQDFVHRKLVKVLRRI